MEPVVFINTIETCFYAGLLTFVILPCVLAFLVWVGCFLTDYSEFKLYKKERQKYDRFIVLKSELRELEREFNKDRRF